MVETVQINPPLIEAPAPTITSSAETRHVPIANMPDWTFWARDIVGATEADRRDFKNGTMSQTRMEELTVAGKMASQTLAEMEVPGFAEWKQELGRHFH
jgi:hypothetical protein